MDTSCKEIFTSKTNSFQARFEGRDLDVVDNFLGFSVKDKSDMTMFNKTKIIERLSRDFIEEFFKPVSTLLPPGLALCVADARSLPDATAYRELVG